MSNRDISSLFADRRLVRLLQAYERFEDVIENLADDRTEDWNNLLSAWSYIEDSEIDQMRDPIPPCARQ